MLRRAHSKLALERLVIKKGAFQGDATAAGGKDSLSAQDLLDLLKGDVRLEVRRPAAPAVVMSPCSFTQAPVVLCQGVHVWAMAFYGARSNCLRHDRRCGDTYPACAGGRPKQHGDECDARHSSRSVLPRRQAAGKLCCCRPWVRAHRAAVCRPPLLGFMTGMHESMHACCLVLLHAVRLAGRAVSFWQGWLPF